MVDALKKMALIVAALFLLSACAVVSSPVGDGLIYTNVKGPVAVTASSANVKHGSASCVNVLGIIALGDCSIQAAMNNGGITKIQHVDHKSKSILSLVSWYTTDVYGK